jgi:hypothetical protein
MISIGPVVDLSCTSLGPSLSISSNGYVALPVRSMAAIPYPILEFLPLECHKLELGITTQLWHMTMPVE